MKKLIVNLMVLALLPVSFISCTAEDPNEELSAFNATTSVQATDIVATDLVGKWTMYSMTSNDLVDFDTNGDHTYDLLEETNCFDSMYFDFLADGNVLTHQSRLFFDATSGEFTCLTSGDYSAQYQVAGNELTVTFTINGQQYTETKTISLYSQNGSDFLKVTLTEAETNAAVYVANDPGNTVVSHIQEIEMVYKKQ